MKRKRGGVIPGSGKYAASVELRMWLRTVPAQLLQDWILAAGGRPPSTKSADLAAELERAWVEEGRLAEIVKACSDDARAVLDGIAHRQFEVPAREMDALLADASGSPRTGKSDARRAVEELERAGLAVRLRHSGYGDALIVFPPVWTLVREFCRPPLRLPEGMSVTADDHPNRFGPGALVAAVLGRVAQKPIRVTRGSQLHESDKRAVAHLLAGYLGDDDWLGARVANLVVCLHGAGLLVVRGERLVPDLVAINAFCVADPERRALRLLAATAQHSRALVAAAVALLDAGGAWCSTKILFADSGWREGSYGRSEAGALMLVDLGLALAGTASDGTKVLRATDILLGAAAGPTQSGLPQSTTAQSTNGRSRAIVQSDFKVLAPEDLPIGWLIALAVHADLVRCDRMWVFELSPASVRRAAEFGASVDSTLELLSQVAGGEAYVPEALAATLRGFAERFTGVRMVFGPVLVFAGPEAAAAAEIALRPITTVYRVGPSVLEVENGEALVRAGQALRRKGYAVTENGESESEGPEFGDLEDPRKPKVDSLAILRARLQESDQDSYRTPAHHLLYRLQSASPLWAQRIADRAGPAAMPDRPPPPSPPMLPWQTDDLMRAISPNSVATVPAAIRNLLEDAIADEALVELKILKSDGQIEIREVIPDSLGEGRSGMLEAFEGNRRVISIVFWRIVEACRL